MKNCRKVLENEYKMKQEEEKMVLLAKESCIGKVRLKCHC